MAYYDTYNNVQFLDLSGVDEDEKKWILTSLQSCDSCVEGPWDKSYDDEDQEETCMQPACTVQIQTDMNMNNGMPPMPFEQYPSPPMIISNHVSPISPQVYPQYQSPIQFVPVPGYAHPAVPFAGTMVPMNASLVPPFVGQPVTFAQPAPLYNLSPTIIKEPVMPEMPVCIQIETNGHDRPLTISPNPDHSQVNGAVSPVVTVTETVAPPAESNMSWASLFNKNKTNSNVEQSMNREHPKSPNTIMQLAPATKQLSSQANFLAKKKSPLAEVNDPNYYRMGELLKSYTLDHKITSLQPRGLINRSNYCYINSILQALLACPPVYNLLVSLGATNTGKECKKYTQIIDNMVKFVGEFHHLPAAQRVRRSADKLAKNPNPPAVVNCDRPFEPHWIYKMLNGMRSDSFVIEGRQEDAEEFLGCLLNGLSDEMLELMKLAGAEEAEPEPQPPSIEDDKSDSEREWQLIGPKNKGCITRRTEVIRTPISDIFGGHIRSKLHRTGDQDTNNIQPFFTLQLNIEKVGSVREALDALVCRNQLEGVTSSKTHKEVEAWQQVTIEELPVVLVLHLKCFDFKLEGCTKIVKALEFPVDLKIDGKLLSSKANYQPKEKQYKLFAVVYHDGKDTTKGHYVTDAYHVGYASWLRYDDATVKTVQEEQVLKPDGTRVPYLLFYRRCDTVRK